jgi:cbb3-type cytochrome oxidase subunit 3
MTTLWRADGPPVTPDASTARQWAVDELSKSEYHQHSSASLLSRLLHWFLGLFSGDVHGLAPGPAAIGVVALVLVVVAVAYVVAGPVRRTARARASHVVLTDDARTSAQLRAAADAAASTGDWDLAVVERFRALVRSLEERALLDEQVGRTADEAARAGAAVLPPCADDLAAAARLFDDVLYGDVHVGPDADELVRRADSRALATRPARRPSPDALVAP